MVVRDSPCSLHGLCEMRGERDTTSLLHGRVKREGSTHRLRQGEMLPTYCREKLEDRILLIDFILKCLMEKRRNEVIIFKLLTVIVMTKSTGTLRNK